MKSKRSYFLLLLLLLLGGYAFYYFVIRENPPLLTVESPAIVPVSEPNNRHETTKSTKSRKRDTSNTTIRTDSTHKRDNDINKTKPIELQYGIDRDGGKLTPYRGRRVNIAVIGVDARIGTSTKHADANHIVSVMLDSGKIEIISIPRDTPADAGFADSNAQNKLTIVHANRGIKAYLTEAAKIANIGKIDYYVEFGFSQAMGIIELLGHKDSKSTLQVLRSRQGLGGDDFQRCYNQGQFIRQNILRNFDRADGFFGEVFIRGGLLLVETNLTAENIKTLFNQLKDKGFPRDSSAITVRVRPTIGTKFKVYDFSDAATIDLLKNKIERYNTLRNKKDTSYANSPPPNVTPQLLKAISIARRDSVRSPKQVIRRLTTYFDQHAWLQVPDKKQREQIRSDFETLLSDAWTRIDKPHQADRIHAVVTAEKQLFEQQEKHQKR
jgi:anionic cell wall polymer biosynthesis LytR-Cps2A-Psr (LCP) family protein